MSTHVLYFQQIALYLPCNVLREGLLSWKRSPPRSIMSTLFSCALINICTPVVLEERAGQRGNRYFISEQISRNIFVNAWLADGVSQHQGLLYLKTAHSSIALSIAHLCHP